MKFEATQLSGVYVIETEWITDERGGFGRTFSADDFRQVDADPNIEQASLSRNPAPGTLRGLHLQREPQGETKVVRCVRGEIFDVAVDLRRRSPTFGQHHAVRLSAANAVALLMCPGVAHGFLTLSADCDVWYQMSTPFVADAATGVRFDDPQLAIAWPAPVNLVSERDRTLPSLQDWSTAV